MIRYLLRCDAGHEFDGWFPGSAAFDDQVRRDLLSCPQCGTTDVGRALMAPAVRTRPARPPVTQPAGQQVVREQPAAAPAAHMPAGPPPSVQGAGVPAALTAALQTLRRHVEQQCEDVGDRFAEEALKIHHGEAEERGIYGHASDEDYHRLTDEGVEIVTIPWVRRADS
ncbi:protein of unknown function DUF1178 [Gluconacetobacter diazotrophicus PA1 5]|uniref:Uncharacterized protein n=2 Tax=Gluconacetobacter diazotrophicus TaxID=33996 RepID=A9HJ36_GLUDA|nr:DUF1178 family protein [Gluconacetobacter diazotrophicus]ACI49928.1 protein of unknown function DUF1178 [Gluconacetobacter diazotrophicus PA1 5]MBB2156479.1 DUF1178 family protein [Gluconacetobacter diazotrophicus]TWB05972.1 hypothetical protein FBZ86_11445 [Gluconacetobacter diazotrophicus]CAP55848.1 conserved hypothetical protein [Gluconacetobacter diazotrophicus PA1 5]